MTSVYKCVQGNFIDVHQTWYYQNPVKATRGLK
jgi:hypothetical protein